MAVDTPMASPSTGEQEWFAESEVPSSRRSTSKWDELRREIKNAPLDGEGKRKFKKVASATMNSATITRMFSASQAGETGFEVRTRRVGKTQHLVTKKGAPNEGQTVPRDTFDVYVRYDEHFVPKSRAAKSDGKAAAKR